MKPQNYSKRRLRIGGWEVNIVSYQLGDRFYCTVDNVSPGAWIARTEGANQEEAEKKALDKATEYLGRTRRISVKS